MNKNLDHDSKPKNIIINGTPTKFNGDEISYSQLVELAFPGGAAIVYTVTYTGPQMADGTLAQGQSIKIRNGVKFYVTKTNRS
ncbi:multiubiquitin domain-containing protein [Shewanella sedimentimangrovi]|uniref:Multiubiquitin domain-containing protein n=1 Tax=Shewanella sedimentimangrovi TaxID=2814293 RepID=A0ABX7R3Y9_9GAMM|nr:multiubiquitin domain-containing protein [Shewanella sedimentimangrovi]QSX37800.1 multiubiquitin domain-containing protein [Shewanella sedimentimangrovi]